jgi:polyisoprenoid-binding protein YceI
MTVTALQQVARPGTWALDSDRSTASFAVRSLAGTVRGTIPITAATVQVSSDGAVGAVSAVLDPAGFRTGHAKRDADVRGIKFLDAGSHPALTFSATRVLAGPGGWTIDGHLVVRDTAAPIKLQAELVEATDELVSVRATGVLDRIKAGVTKMPNLMIARTLRISLDVTFRLVS